MMNERGLVISCPIEASDASLIVKTTSLDSQELRSALLFWDKLDFPENSLIGFGLDQDAAFLLSEGILKRTKVQVGGSGNLENGFVAAHLEAYRLLDEQEPGVWSLGAGENSISILDAELEEGGGALVRPWTHKRAARYGLLPA